MIHVKTFSGGNIEYDVAKFLNDLKLYTLIDTKFGRDEKGWWAVVIYKD